MGSSEKQASLKIDKSTTNKIVEAKCPEEESDTPSSEGESEPKQEEEAKQEAKEEAK